MVIVLSFFDSCFVFGQWREIRGAKLSISYLSDGILLAVSFQWLTPIAPTNHHDKFLHNTSRKLTKVTPVVGNVRNFLNRLSPSIFLFSRNHWLSENRAKAK
jgi:hypothetical protein